WRHRSIAITVAVANTTAMPYRYRCRTGTRCRPGGGARDACGRWSRELPPRRRSRRRRRAGHLDVLLLAALSDGPRHGYAVKEALREGSGGRFDLPTGTVYPALHRLEAAGLIAGSWSVVDGRRRRSYRLTAAGRRR